MPEAHRAPALLTSSDSRGPWSATTTFSRAARTSSRRALSAGSLENGGKRLDAAVHLHHPLDVQLQAPDVLDQIHGERRRRGEWRGTGSRMEGIGLHQQLLAGQVRREPRVGVEVPLEVMELERHAGVAQNTRATHRLENRRWARSLLAARLWRESVPEDPLEVRLVLLVRDDGNARGDIAAETA